MWLAWPSCSGTKQQVPAAGAAKPEFSGILIGIKIWLSVWSA